MQKHKTALIWFTNNLRVNDNTLLSKACNEFDSVVAIYCFDPKHFKKNNFGYKKTGKYRTKFLIETIHELKRNLHSLNIPLYTYTDSAEKQIPKLIKELNIDSIFFQQEFTFEETQTINHIKTGLPKNVKVIEYYDQFLYHPDDIPFSIKNIPDVFTSFRKELEKNCLVKQATQVIKKHVNLSFKNTTTIPTLKELGFTDYTENRNTAFPFKGGEKEALKRVQYYFFETQKLSFYKKTRNGLIGIDYSSKLSAWLSNGSISARTIYWTIKEYEDKTTKNQSTYWLYFELLWRDYFKYISLKHGKQLFKQNGILQKEYLWKNNATEIKQWVNGKTKDDFVNANMIELKETGWMSNRGRQNVASFFAKELLIDWRIGASYFESLLIDYDVHSNYGNWQYVAGVGNDPRNRKFNTQLQAQRYDKNHAFRNLWLQPTLF